MYYIYDFTGDGYAEVSEINLHNEDALIGTAKTYKEAVAMATEYEIKIQDEIDKSTGNYEYDPEDFDAEEDLREQKKDYYNNNPTLTF